MGAKIMIKKTDGSQLLDLTSDVSSIGRSEDNTVVLDDAACSRHHAQIRLEGGRYALVDLGSLNGTLVNGEQVTGTRDLRDGDVVTIGTTNLIFSLSPEQATQAFPASTAPQPQTRGAPRVVQPQKPPVSPAREPALAGATSGRATAKAAAASAGVAARPKAKGSKKALILILVAVLVVLLLACAGGVFFAFNQGWISFV